VTVPIYRGMTLKSRTRQLAALLVFTATIAALSAGGASATHTWAAVDCGSSNLQGAIDAAAPGSTLSITGTCQGTFVVSKSLTLKGADDNATLDAQGANTTLIVTGTIRVTVKRLTITNGSDGFGGGIDVFRATLSLVDSTVTGNEACHGGGLAAGSAIVYITGSTVSGNQGDCEGGGVYAERSLLIVSNSTISGNATSGNGGGLGLYLATASLMSTSVQGNQAVDGGGIYLDASAGPTNLMLIGGSVSGNTASDDGGGILNTPGGHVLLSAGATVSANAPDDCSGC
jgi:nitrous oxidase accessory protein NosD